MSKGKEDIFKAPIKICIAGITGWTGSVIARQLIASNEFELVGAIARQQAGQDLGEALGGTANGITIYQSLEEVLPTVPNLTC